MSQRVFEYKKWSGIAGQIGVSVIEVGNGPKRVSGSFFGSTYGGPVVMILPSGLQTFVTNPERFGKFEADRVAWAAAFTSALKEDGK